jgi:hypothetical protein
MQRNLTKPILRRIRAYPMFLLGLFVRAAVDCATIYAAHDPKWHRVVILVLMNQMASVWLMLLSSIVKEPNTGFSPRSTTSTVRISPVFYCRRTIILSAEVW